MSLLAILSPAASALPAINIHPHGHKRGSHVEAANESGSDTAAQVPAGAVQNLFGTLLQSLEQVIGVQSSVATPNSAAPAAGANATSAAFTASNSGAPKLAGSNINVKA
jgi:hypothetical protein